jgi:glycosyltransferase involved in cell wall biosynthesis
LVIHAQTALEDCFKLWANGRGATETRQMINDDPRITLIEREVGEPGLYNCGDVYVYPSRLDGIGLTLAEASASGMPVITTDAPPMNEMVQHGANGRLVAVKSYEQRQDGYYWPVSVCERASLVEAMQWYIDNIGELHQLKRAARQYAKQHLNWSRNAASLSLTLSGLMRRRDLVTADVMHAVNNYEQRSARFRWLPLSYEVRLRRLGLDRVYSRAKAALKRRK